MFTYTMVTYGFQQSRFDHTLFMKKQGDKLTCLVIYVDDMIITCYDIEEVYTRYPR